MLSLYLRKMRRVNHDFLWGEDSLLHKVELWRISKAARDPEERLLELVVTLSRDVVVLEVVSAMEGDHLGLDFAITDVYLVADQNDRDVIANAG